jgi:predicted GTPase
MGACISNGVDAKALKASRDLDKLINKAYAIESDKVKLLLLGAGESGKSTIFKQMRVLFGAPLSEEEINQITPVVYSNTISSMKMLVRAVRDMGYDEEVRICLYFYRWKT